MGALSERKIEIVRTLVESAPDKVVGGLQRALAQSEGDKVLADVRALVEAEAADRALRNAVLQCVAPLCVGDGSDASRLVFPARALAAVWRGLKVSAPEEVAAATAVRAAILATPQDKRPPDPGPTHDVLARLAAAGLRGGELRDFRAAAEACERARRGGAEQLAACLDLAPVVRRYSQRLPEWLAQADDGETAAAARVSYKDAVEISEDAGPRYFEMLAGQLQPSWMVLRVISAVMDKPSQRYLAQSELGGFAERVMDEIDGSLAALGRLDASGGAGAGRAAGKLAQLITQQCAELDRCIELTRESGWGLRIFNQKKALAQAAERHLREAEKAAVAALPTTTAKGGVKRTVPVLGDGPEAAAMTRALTLLTFADEVRSCANYAGFSAAHAKLTEKLGPLIDHYVETVLDCLRAAEPEEKAAGCAYLTLAAELCALVRDDRAADLIRRRAATACQSAA